MVPEIHTGAFMYSFSGKTLYPYHIQDGERLRGTDRDYVIFIILKKYMQ